MLSFSISANTDAVAATMFVMSICNAVGIMRSGEATMGPWQVAALCLECLGDECIPVFVLKEIP